MSSSPVDISHISGNASDKTKQALASVHRIFTNRTSNANAGPVFGESIQKRLKVTEVSVNQKAEEPQRLEGKVVLEATIEEGE
jgi:acyl-coenzyme A thioesterase 13